LANDGTGTEEADAGHDLRGDARRICPNDALTRGEELVEAVRGDDREERGPDGDERVCPQAGLTFPELALDGDGSAEECRELEARLPGHDPDRDRGYGFRERPAQPEAPERAARRDVRTGDRGTARAAVGLQHAAVHPQRSLAERLEVGDGTQRAADQPLDLDG